MGDPKGMWRSVNELTYRKFTSSSSIRELHVTPSQNPMKCVRFKTTTLRLLVLILLRLCLMEPQVLNHT